MLRPRAVGRVDASASGNGKTPLLMFFALPVVPSERLECLFSFDTFM